MIKMDKKIEELELAVEAIWDKEAVKKHLIYHEVILEKRISELEASLEVKYENETGHALYHKDKLEPRISELEKIQLELKETLINTDTLGIVYLKGQIAELKERMMCIEEAATEKRTQINELKESHELQKEYNTIKRGKIKEVLRDIINDIFGDEKIKKLLEKLDAGGEKENTELNDRIKRFKVGMTEEEYEKYKKGENWVYQDEKPPEPITPEGLDIALEVGIAKIISLEETKRFNEPREISCPKCVNEKMVIVNFLYNRSTTEIIPNAGKRRMCLYCGLQSEICRECGKSEDEVKLKTDMGDGGYVCVECIVKKRERKMCPNCFNINKELEIYFFINNKISIKCLNCGYVR